jgi:uncharacterized protein (DUF1810 family)
LSLSWENTVSPPRLRQITEALLLHAGTSADTILGSHIDAIKVRSCMTLFDILSPNDIFGRVLDTFYDVAVGSWDSPQEFLEVVFR